MHNEVPKQEEPPKQEIPETQFQLSEQDKRAFCALLLKKFGISLSVRNEFLPMYYMAYMSAVISEKTAQRAESKTVKIIDDFDKRLSHSLKETLSGIHQVAEGFKKDAADNVAKLETNQYRFDNPETAFYFALGKYGIIASVAMVLVFIGFLVVYLSR